MEIKNDQLVVYALKCVERVVSSYPIHNKLWMTIRLGSEGTGPDIAVEFRGRHYDQMSPGGNITFWLHPHDKSKFVLIYSMFDPVSGNIDHHSVDLSELSEAEHYFDQAMALFNLKPNEPSL